MANQSHSLKAEVARIRNSWPDINLSNPVLFIANLRMVHSMIVASEPLLRAASALSAGDLATYFRDHLNEESDHALWLAEDLMAEGVDVTDEVVLPEVASLVGAQYYQVLHVHPAALLGYMLVLECFPPPIDEIDRLEIIHGLSALRTVRHHAVHDGEHGDGLLAVIDSLPDDQASLVRINALNTATHIGHALNSMLARNLAN